jgi:CubicO group peptidase (beta-lactamase class C family)
MKQLYLLLLFIGAAYYATAQNLYFPPNNSTTWDTTAPSSLGYCPDRIDSLKQYLDQTDSKAFILLQDGKIVLEFYYDNFTKDSLWYWASAGKSLTAYLVGIAQQEGYLSIEDTTSQYLGNGWTALTPAQEQAITIRNQLAMTTGLDDGVPEVDCTLDTCLQYLAPPGSRWAYHNAPYTLLDQAIEQSTGRNINTYVVQKIKQPTGMDGLYLSVGYNKVYFSTPRSMARFGLLTLNKGHWNGTPVLSDTAYFNAMTTPSQTLNPAYGYLWWLNGQSSYQLPGIPFNIVGEMSPNAPDDVIAALGKNGQMVNVSPSRNLVWIRMGNTPSAGFVPNFYNDSIWIKINALDCSAVATGQVAMAVATHIFPNPAQKEVQVQAAVPIERWALYNASGQLIKQGTANTTAVRIRLTQQKQGYYYLQLFYSNGQHSQYPLLKQ